ncbi:MAG: hypothetical protein U9N82_00205 [Thermodesulfobacteriota bacterium]|nr:hypothetical protein [Thermodesulfobacteriota bacterium]
MPPGRGLTPACIHKYLKVSLTTLTQSILIRWGTDQYPSAYSLQANNLSYAPYLLRRLQTGLPAIASRSGEAGGQRKAYVTMEESPLGLSPVK